MSVPAQLVSTPGLDAVPGTPIVVVGTGPVGLRVTAELLARLADPAIVLYGSEPWVPYDRVRLSSLLAGDVTLEDIAAPFPHDQIPGRVTARLNCPVVALDRAAGVVIDAEGRRQPYSRLVLATGSRPRVPDIPGMRLPGVYTFRDLDDTERLLARMTRTRRVVVLGGGLLGLEAARAMQRHHTLVTVVEHNPWLMMQQLDEEAAERLRGIVAERGIEVRLGDGVKTVRGTERVEGVSLRSGDILPCDTLIVAAGIQPNLDLAWQAGLALGRGIKVDDTLTTSDPRIHAIGECAEHEGVVYGLVAPGLEQAAVLADRMTGGDGRYTGSVTAARLKVVGAEVDSVGRTGFGEARGPAREVSYRSDDGNFRKVFVDRDRVVGAISIGPWPAFPRMQEAVRHQRRLWPWQLRRFRSHGVLWDAEGTTGVADWPDDAVVCNCRSVSRGRLGDAIGGGCQDMPALAADTGASTVCGSCRPLLAELLGMARLEPVRGARALLLTAALGMLGALAFLFAPDIPYNTSVQAPWRWDLLWREELAKQVSGFTLLGLAILLAALSLRKRIRRLEVGDFALWRVVHVVVGVLALLALLAHTGLRLGSSLNSALMLTFLALLVLGTVAGAAIALEHALPRQLVRRVRATAVWLHILLLWPVPVLLGFHVLKTYYY